MKLIDWKRASDTVSLHIVLAGRHSLVTPIDWKHDNPQGTPHHGFGSVANLW